MKRFFEKIQGLTRAVAAHIVQAMLLPLQ